MRAVKNAYLPKQKYRDPTSCAFFNFSTKVNKQGLNITPLDIGTRRSGENQINNALVLPLHVYMVPLLGTAIKRPGTSRYLVAS